MYMGLDVYECLWMYVNVNIYQWIFIIDVYECLRIVCGYPWMSMDAFGDLCLYSVECGCLWISMQVNGYHRHLRI